ncbi:MAG: serine/threonine-protein kinase [Myxococcaceae bacterium]
MGAAGLPLGRYVLGERLAVGGMGEVYIGVQKGLGDFEKPLAIKLLLPHLAEDTNAVAEFLNEAKVASRLSNPHIVQIHDVGQEGGRYFLAMELVRGVSLNELLSRLERRREHLSPELICFIAHGLLDGLHHAHELRDPNGRLVELVHRDVSPHNVLVSSSGEVKLADFGLARASDARTSTRTGVVRGKPSYLAPEIFDGVPANRKSDVFGAAVTIFQLATLISPFRRETDAATMKAVINDPLPKLRALRPEIPEALEKALELGTARDPTQRAPTALALREAIPVIYGPTAARDLGALIERVAGDSVRQLDQRASNTRQMLRGGGTKEASLSVQVVAPGETKTVAQPPPPPPKSRAPMFAALAIAVVALALGAYAALKPSPDRRGPTEAQPPRGEVTEKLPPRIEPVIDAGIVAVAPEIQDAGPLTSPGVQPSLHTRPLLSGEASKKGPRIGYLTVDAVPWASVSVRGKPIGDTPLYRFPIDEGDVQVELKNPDTGKSVTRRVKVHQGKESSLKVNLQ